jgi:hypothetical protein
MWGQAPRLLNIAMVKVSDQNPIDMAKLRSWMDANYEYLHHELSERGFRDCVRHLMKRRT